VVAVVVPTRDRHSELANLLSLLGQQSLAPRSVIVVDASESPPSTVSEAIPLRTVRATPGLAGVQRNIGIDLAMADSDVRFIALLDDDVEPAEDYLQRLVGGLERDPSAAGISGVAVATTARGNAPMRYGRWRRMILRVCLFTGSRNGSMLASGVNVGFDNDDEEGTVEVDWLIGCSVWRRDAITEVRFDADDEATFLGDDVLFSLLARRHGRLLVDTSVILPHRMSPIGRHQAPEHWAEWIRSRRRIVARAPNGRRSAYWLTTTAGIAFLTIGALRGSPESRASLRSARHAAVDVFRGRY
jgi:GT2 family glycosyltransferase